MSQGQQQGSYQCGFTRAQIAIQVNNQPWFQQGRQFASQRPGGGFVGQNELRGTISLMHEQFSPSSLSLLAARIKSIGHALGFSAIGIAHADVRDAAPRLKEWLNRRFHGEMDYMARHADLRSSPEALYPGTVAVISAALDYLPPQTPLSPPDQVHISRYARGRDYHKVMRQRLERLARTLTTEIGPFGYRVFSDSAPVMEVAFARQAGLGWQGKNTLLISRQGSWRFLGEIYTNLPLPADLPTPNHCGNCNACLQACPTRAIIAPYQVDARRCISYLTIEFAGSIPEEWRSLIGQRIYGCDACQLCCPWNRFAQAGDPAFLARPELDRPTLPELFAWDENEFMSRLQGNPIRRIGHERWLRNLSIALGNAPTSPAILEALRSRSGHPSALVREHVAWALLRHQTGTVPPPGSTD